MRVKEEKLKDLENLGYKLVKYVNFNVYKKDFITGNNVIVSLVDRFIHLNINSVNNDLIEIDELLENGFIEI